MESFLLVPQGAHVIPGVILGSFGSSSWCVWEGILQETVSTFDLRFNGDFVATTADAYDHHCCDLTKAIIQTLVKVTIVPANRWVT